MQKICYEVIKNIDFSVLEGARTLKKQQYYFNEGTEWAVGAYHKVGKVFS